MWSTVLSAPWHVEASWTRDPTGVPRIERQILNHWPTREAPVMEILDQQNHSRKEFASYPVDDRNVTRFSWKLALFNNIVLVSGA